MQTNRSLSSVTKICETMHPSSPLSSIVLKILFKSFDENSHRLCSAYAFRVPLSRKMSICISVITFSIHPHPRYETMSDNQSYPRGRGRIVAIINETFHLQPQNPLSEIPVQISIVSPFVN